MSNHGLSVYNILPPYYAQLLVVLVAMDQSNPSRCQSSRRTNPPILCLAAIAGSLPAVYLCYIYWPQKSISLSIEPWSEKPING